MPSNELKECFSKCIDLKKFKFTYLKLMYAWFKTVHSIQRKSGKSSSVDRVVMLYQ